MPKPEGDKGFDLDQMAREVADESDATSSDDTAEEVVDDAADDTTADETVEEEVVAAPAPAAEEEDDEKWAASHGAKPIPQAAFQARLQRWKKQGTERENRILALQAENEGLRKAAPATAEDLERFKRLDGVFQNLDKSAKELPWMTPVLLALGQGKKPDWEKAKADMEAYLVSVPKGDPILYQQQQEMRAQIEEMQSERLSNQATSHIQTEDVEIAKILGAKNDPAAASWWAILNEQALNASANMKSLKDAPNRVAMAKRLVAAAEAYSQKKMKGALPPATRAKAPVTGNGGGGGAPSTKDKAPKDINSPEFQDWFLKGL